MSSVYIVMGTVGEYSDRTEWPVALYVHRRKAQSHVVKAASRSRLIHILQAKNRKDGGSREDAGKLAVNEFDPGMEVDSYHSDWARYFIYEVQSEGDHIDAATAGAEYRCCNITWTGRGRCGYWWPKHAGNCPSRVGPTAFNRPT